MENEKRLIDPHDLWTDIMMLPHNGDMISSEEVEQAIKDAPTVEAVEVVHGRWRRFINGDGEYKYLCNVCEKIVTYEMGGSPYCPNCGANMRGSEE